MTLRTPPGTRWAVSVVPPNAEAVVLLEPEGEPGRLAQHLTLTAVGPGVVQLEALRQRMPQRTPTRGPKQQSPPALEPVGLVRWHLTVVVEPAEPSEISEGPGAQDTAQAD